MEQPILDMFLSGDPSNIDLAFSIMKGQKIKVGYFISKYFGKLLKYFKLKETKEGVKELFSITTFEETAGNIIPDNLYYLTNLKGFKLNYKDLTEIPLSVCKIPNLTHLDITNNNITEIPKEIINLKHLKHLKVLNLSDNRLGRSGEIEYLDKFIKEIGWIEGLSDMSNIAIFLVIQHSNLEYQLKYYDIIKEAYKDKKITSSLFAMFIDRVKIRQGKLQIFGTQVNEKGEYCKAEPLETLNKNREKIGLSKISF